MPLILQVVSSSNAYGGGAIYADEGVAIHLSGAVVLRENWVNNCAGGGIYVTHGSTVSVSGSVLFAGNQGSSGGAIHAEFKVNISISGRVRFEGNVANPNGGGAILTSGFLPPALVFICFALAQINEKHNLHDLVRG